MADPFDELAEEHRVIEKVLTALEAAATQDVALGFYEQALEFAAKFADTYHHTKEEELLFQYLEERGMPRDYGPLGVIISEHDTGREHVDAMRAYLAAEDVESLRREALAYVAMMRKHIDEEDNVLFPMGRAMLTAEEIEEIRKTFEAVAEPEPSRAAFLESAEQLLADVA